MAIVQHPRNKLRRPNHARNISNYLSVLDLEYLISWWPSTPLDSNSDTTIGDGYMPPPSTSPPKKQLIMITELVVCFKNPIPQTASPLAVIGLSIVSPTCDTRRPTLKSASNLNSSCLQHKPTMEKNTPTAQMRYKKRTQALAVESIIN